MKDQLGQAQANIETGKRWGRRRRDGDHDTMTTATKTRYYSIYKRLATYPENRGERVLALHRWHYHEGYPRFHNKGECIAEVERLRGTSDDILFTARDQDGEYIT